MVKVTLFVGGERLIPLNAAEATTHVTRFERQSDGNTVIKVDISCRSWSQESIEVLLAFLANHAKDIRYLNLADIIASKLTEEGLQITESIANTFLESNLLEVELSDNAMGPRGLMRVQSLFTNSSLERLYLYNCGLDFESMKLLHGWIMADDGRIANSLSELVLDRNMIGVKGAEEVGKFLPHCKKLKYFSYIGCRPESDGTKYICDGLAEMARKCKPVLRRLDLDDCDFGVDGAVDSLCEALSKSNQLQYLNLNDAELEVEGLEKLVAALTESNAALTHLKLGTYSLSLRLATHTRIL
jgi:Ran GTPase-activating protein 1